MVTTGAKAPQQEADSTPQIVDLKLYADIEKSIQAIRIQAEHTGTYTAALLSTGNTVPIFAAFVSVLLYVTLSRIKWEPWLPWLTLSTTAGSLFALLCWLFVARMYKRSTAVDRASAASYEHLLNRLQQAAAWYATLTPRPSPNCNSLYAIGMQEISSSFNAICKCLQTPGPSWIGASGYVSAWKLMHRIDEAFIEIEPVEAVIHNALHDEMSLQTSTLTNRDDLLNKLRRAVKLLDEGAAAYLNQQPPQEQPASPDGKTRQPDLQATLSTMQKPIIPKDDVFNKLRRAVKLLAQGATAYLNQKAPPDDQTKQPDLQTTLPTVQQPVTPKKPNEEFSNTIDVGTQARTIIYEVRNTLHHFRDDRWDKLLRVRNQLMKMTLVTGLVLYLFVEFAIMMNVGAELLEAATILYFVGGLVGLFSRLYDQSKTDTSIDDFRLATARLIAAPLYSGLSAIGGVLVVQRTFELNVTSILIAAAFGLTPSLFTSAIQKEADQYKTDLKSTTAPTGEKQKNSY